MNVKTGGQSSEMGLITLLTQVSKALHRRTSEELLGMRLKQYMALGFVREHPGVTQQELETALMMDANSVVLLLNELEAGRLSIRRRDPEDRRRHLVELTPEGAHALERADKGRETLEELLLTDMSPSERATLRDLLKRVLGHLLQEAPEASTRA